MNEAALKPRPNLFIIGAAKCGTTSLHWALDSHTDIFMSRLKEPGFFVPEFSYHPKDERWYLALFDEAGSARWVGESSTHYTKIPYYEGVPERLHAFAPDARLIYLMRDPIDRAMSHYWHNTRAARPEFTEGRPMLQAIAEDPLYRDFGDYAMQLRPWFDLFGRDAVLPLVYEEMVQAAPATLRKVLLWLDLDASTELELEHRNRRQKTTVRPRGRGLLHRFSRSRVWDALAPLVPQRVKEVGRRIALEERAPAFADESAEVTELLRPWAAERIAALRALLDRGFPLWQTSLGLPAR